MNKYDRGYLDSSPLKQYTDIVDGSVGDLSSIITKTLTGISHKSTGIPLKHNTDNHGITFFTRPRLNLSQDNIKMSRTFAQVSMALDNDAPTLQRIVRDILDPISAKAENSPYINNKQAFITPFTNLLTNLSGFPDSVMDMHTSPAGIAKETWSMMDSLPLDLTTFDLTATFRNIDGDVVTLLTHLWTQYASQVAYGTLIPRETDIIENEMDYNTRIYRLVLDANRKYVQKIAAVGYATPYVTPLGAAFNYDAATPGVRDNDTVTIPFKCSWMYYNDTILVEEFNGTVSDANPSMLESVRENSMTKVYGIDRDIMNFNIYPNINPDTMELEWWAETEELLIAKGNLNSLGLRVENTTLT